MLVDVAADHSGPLAPLLERALAVRIRGALPPAQARAFAEGVRAARADWNTDFEGAQFSLGRAWYTHLEQGRAAEYFADVARSDALVERSCPGLQAIARSLASRVVGSEVVAREGWCGPGVHVFPAGGLVANVGGEVHYDTEGITPAHADSRAPAYTLVLMLDPPESGGALRVWDVEYEGSDSHEDEDLERPHVTCEYDAGDVVVIDSYRLHQIQPFGGARDRISLTCHMACAGARESSQWETWF